MKIFNHFICTLVCSLVTIAAIGNDSTVALKNGVADLRGIPFSSKSYSLKGNCAFEWNRLLQPGEEFSAGPYVEFPQTWNNTLYKGKNLPGQGYATYGITLLLPANGKPLALTMPVVYTSYKLFVNGKLLAQNGVPGTTGKNTRAKWVPVTVSLPTGTGKAEILLQVSNFSHYKGGANISMEIGEATRMFIEKERAIAGDFLLAGCLFMGGLFFFGLYYFGTKDKATFYFSFFCMLYSYRMVGCTPFYALHTVLPSLPFELTVRLEYISLFGGVFLFFQYIRHLFPKDVHQPLVKILSVTSLAYGAISLLAPVSFFTQFLHSFLFVVLFCICYLVFVFTKAYVKRRVAAGYALTSVGVLMLIQLIGELEYFGVMVPSRLLLFTGHIAFFFLQSLILSFRFAYTMQQAKKQAEEGLQAKSEFLSTMSHEIRTPLNSVIGMSNLMQQNNPRPDQKEQLDVLQFSAKNLLSIVNDILDYNKIEAGMVSFEQIEMNLPEMIQHIAAGAKYTAEEKGIKIRLKVDSEINQYMVGDPTRLSQVLHNLVGNAVKFTKEGEVMIEVTVLEKNDATASILFSVKDTGIGIPKEKQLLIFERFTQADSSTSRSFGGTGLGLTITKKILELQGSKLQLTSEEGKGSTFFFTQSFAVSKRQIEVKEKVIVLPAREKQPLKGIHILLVEDNPINILVAKTFLESWGAAIDVAENGQEAVDRLDTSKHHLVLMDLHMPVMDGYTAIRTIRGKGITIPIIALTASLPNEVETEIKGLDIDDFVLKPFVPDELFRKVKDTACTVS